MSRLQVVFTWFPIHFSDRYNYGRANGTLWSGGRELSAATGNEPRGSSQALPAGKGTGQVLSPQDSCLEEPMRNKNLLKGSRVRGEGCNSGRQERRTWHPSWKMFAMMYRILHLTTQLSGFKFWLFLISCVTFDKSLNHFKSPFPSGLTVASSHDAVRIQCQALIRVPDIH